MCVCVCVCVFKKMCKSSQEYLRNLKILFIIEWIIYMCVCECVCILLCVFLEEMCKKKKLKWQIMQHIWKCFSFIFEWISLLKSKNYKIFFLLWENKFIKSWICLKFLHSQKKVHRSTAVYFFFSKWQPLKILCVCVCVKYFPRIYLVRK